MILCIDMILCNFIMCVIACTYVQCYITIIVVRHRSGETANVGISMIYSGLAELRSATLAAAGRNFIVIESSCDASLLIMGSINIIWAGVHMKLCINIVFGFFFRKWGSGRSLKHNPNKKLCLSIL